VIDVPDPQPAPRGRTDRTIPVTCRIHGSRGFCNLRMTKVGGEIVLTFNEEAARAVFEAFRE
jgi:hypothetical protein